ncbi:hypothetical protein LCGC14_1621470 [marine sediment metagenome]|uniref:Uncharacterized protein n=1 Tax=marine sediment metagenome TaxID=412755 RepID=A0A0F9ISC0_9ZZZZ
MPAFWIILSIGLICVVGVFLVVVTRPALAEVRRIKPYELPPYELPPVSKMYGTRRNYCKPL